MTPASTGGRRRVAGERRDRVTSPDAPTVSTPLLQKRPASDRDPVSPKPAPKAPGKQGAVRDYRPPMPTARPPRLQLVLRAVAVLVAVAVVTATVLVLVADRRQQQLADARTSATEAARSAAAVVLSYDYETLDADFAAAQEVSTGDFKKEYAETSENAIRSVATQTQAQVKAEALTSGVVSATPDKVVVLLFVDQTTLSNRLDQPQTDQNRVRFTMVRTVVDGQDRWLVSEVDAL